MLSYSLRSKKYLNDSVSQSRLLPLPNLRQDSESSQAIIRLIVGIAAMAYLIYTILLDGKISQNDYYTLSIGGFFFIFALSLILWLRRDPQISPVRRILGILLDNGATTAALYFHDELGAPLFIIYLWVAFGNGFRYGQAYLVFSATCSVFGFLFVAASSDYFRDNLYISYALLLGLIVLPIYIAALLQELKKTLEIAENANQVKSNFLATMSHEIRTPLNGLVGVTELLGKTNLNEKQKHYVSLISKSSEWLMRVITDGLDFTKIEANEFLLLKEKFDLPRSLLDVCSLYKRMHRKKSVVFSHQISPQLPQIVIGDQLRLTQVLGNLLSNSFKYTEKGSVTLSVELLEEKKIGILAQFMVKDTGPGIPVEEQDIIFEPFKQVPTKGRMEVGGTGLGLAIAQRLIRLMGGELEVKSNPGEGSTFFFTLFFRTVNLKNEVEPDEPPPETDIHWKKPPAILLVEDHEINREVIVNQLFGMGCQVKIAENGLEAVTEIENNHFDLILMDCQMPLLDGYDATRRIRKLEAQKSDSTHTPIIALTAHVTMGDREKCLESGMDDYLGKPFRVADLQKKLSYWLDAQHQHHQESSIEPLRSPLQEKTMAPKEPMPDQQRKLIHDLRNSLFVIQANTEFANNPMFAKDQKRAYTEIIHEAVKKAVVTLEELSEVNKNT